jgi:hypothetical protein
MTVGADPGVFQGSAVDFRAAITAYNAQLDGSRERH